MIRALALAAGLAAANARAAKGPEPLFRVLSVAGAATVDGRTLKRGDALVAGERIRIAGSVTLRAVGYVARYRGPGVVAVGKTSSPALSFSTGSILAVRGPRAGRLHFQTPAAGMDVGYESFYLEARGTETYVCVCEADNGQPSDARKHSAFLWTGDSPRRAPGLQGHSERELAALRKMLRVTSSGRHPR